MGKATVAFCDMCQSRDGAVTNYEIKFPTGKLILDLCENHGSVLEELKKKCERLFLRNGTQGRRRPRVAITPEAL